MISYDEALAASINEFKGDELAAKIFVDKYALRNKDRELLEKTPSDMFRRVAREIARVEAKKFAKPLTEDEIFDLLDGFKRIVPQGSPLYGIGNYEQFVTLSSCYVLHQPPDSYGGIMFVDEELVQISKRRGGCGIELSNIRPANSPTANASRTSTGVVSFATRYSNSAREVGQDGRRGALMLCLSVHHPEVLDFAKCKLDKTKVTGANISIRLSDEFLQAVENGTTYQQRYPVDSKNPTIVKNVDARSLWNELIKLAHSVAEPGLLFWDRILSESPADRYWEYGFITIGTNPCSELPLCVLDSCRLLVQNLFTYVNNPFTAEAHFDAERFYADAKLAQRMMDDIVDLEIEAIDRIIAKVERDPEDREIKQRELQLWARIKEKCIQGRRSGTGLTGLADTLAAIGMQYGSEESILMVDRIYKILKFACYESSIEMAEELGPFPIWDSSLDSQCPFFLRWLDEVVHVGDRLVKGAELYERMMKSGRRNIALLTSAPVGTMSNQCQTSSAIEPVYAISYLRKKKGNLKDDGFRVDYVDANGDKWMQFEVFHPKYLQWQNTPNHIPDPYINATADKIDWHARINLQAAAQKHIDHAISSTINLPKDTPVETVAKIYETAWKAGCKGITVYRDGSRDGVLTKTSDDAGKRPRELACDVHHITVDKQQYFVLVGMKDGKPYEVFAGKNGFLPKKIKIGKIVRKRKNYYKALFDDDVELSPITAMCDEMEEAITRLTSALLRSGADMTLVVDQLEKVGSEGSMYSFSRSISRALKKYIPDGTVVHGELCEECKSQLVRENGCKTCKNCGWSKCL